VNPELRTLTPPFPNVKTNHDAASADLQLRLSVKRTGSTQYRLSQETGLTVPGATGTALFNAEAGLDTAETRLQLTALNLLSARANDFRYYYYSLRLEGESAAGTATFTFTPSSLGSAEFR